ncbi:glycosyltransferase family protein [Corynebacterium epidermidicanis]|uniref:Mannosyltransferase (PIG-V) n=1 Tax=Corynebacterium epidermidicanis TaxID=1050174 RepID=A0A0G3GLS1_9CORY|nr:hypothetical protein [Corynebacterium epidermidicanis]AKK02136.1 Mannosyltransferase (PIG-V) [Corynebacterium epidermidicanis]
MTAPAAPRQSLPRIHPDWFWAAGVFLVTSAVRLLVVLLLADERGKSLTSVLDRWDAMHYQAIARGGYFETGPGIPANDFETRLAFFPLFPFTMRLVSEITGLSLFQAGILINVVAGTALVAAAMFIAGHMGAGLRGRIAAGVLVAGAPMALTYNMTYTEAMFAAFAYWALWAMLQRRWWLAGVLVFFTCLTRLTGIDLFIVFAIVVLAWGRTRLSAWIALVISSLGLISYLGFVQSHTRDIGGYFGLQKKGWNSTFDFGESVLRFLRWGFSGTSDSWVVICGFFILATVVCLLATLPSALGSVRSGGGLGQVGGVAGVGESALPWPVWLFSAGVAANILLSDGVLTARPRLLLPAIICLLPVALAISRGFVGDGVETGSGVAADGSPDEMRVSGGLSTALRVMSYLRWGLLLLSWVVFGALISGHPLIATKWAI